MSVKENWILHTKSKFIIVFIRDQRPTLEIYTFTVRFELLTSITEKVDIKTDLSLFYNTDVHELSYQREGNLYKCHPFH